MLRTEGQLVILPVGSIISVSAALPYFLFGDENPFIQRNVECVRRHVCFVIPAGSGARPVLSALWGTERRKVLFRKGETAGKAGQAKRLTHF